MKSTRVTVIVVGHGKRAGDEFSCRRHYEVGQAVGEGCEGEKGQRCSCSKTRPPGLIGLHLFGAIGPVLAWCSTSRRHP